ncbi:MAG: Crp/Fnr family transcriptional regulator [Deltaproteobacteria bacterium]|nr:Crp/Fnr family transcriptional regulator [Deltaproteobacteria bacterium]
MGKERGSVQDFLEHFAAFRQQEGLAAELLANAHRVRLEAGSHLYWEGDACEGIGFVVAGEVRVYQTSEVGREITLYEIGPGETCILNASCILGRSAYPANAVTTTQAELFLVPAADFRRLLAERDEVRAFLFSLLSRRLAEVMALVHEVAFGRMDERLLEYLIEKSQDCVLHSTHQRIANDLGTSREVVSRILKEFERQGRVSLARNSIRLLEGSAD